MMMEEDDEEDTGAATTATPLASRPNWHRRGEMWTYREDAVARPARVAIAAFDVDGTLIETRTGRRFPIDADDWRVRFADTSRRLVALVADGYRIALFTNQMRLTDGADDVERDRKFNAYAAAIEELERQLAVPLQAFVAVGRAGLYYRKPNIGMWTFLKNALTPIGASWGDAVPWGIDAAASFYVGDAAGRPARQNGGADPARKRDFGCCDRLFALNIGIAFHTPEEFFEDRASEAYALPAFDPRAVVASQGAETVTIPSTVVTDDRPNRWQLIVMVGCPASGKSHYVARHLLPIDFWRVSGDDLGGDWRRCVRVATEALSRGFNVVIDNTNPTVATRRRYVAIARSVAGAVARCFVMTTSLDQARHNERFRRVTTLCRRVPDAAFTTFAARYREPDAVAEGFADVVRVSFTPQFGCRSDAQMYARYLMDA
jgi:bifunctional polynucleotide phosphatase/kinase